MDWLLWKAIKHYLPAEYMAPAVIVLSAVIALEQWLAGTKRVKANSTLQAVMNTLNYFLGKMQAKEEIKK